MLFAIDCTGFGKVKLKSCAVHRKYIGFCAKKKTRIGDNWYGFAPNCMETPFWEFLDVK